MKYIAALIIIAVSDSGDRVLQDAGIVIGNMQLGETEVGEFDSREEAEGRILEVQDALEAHKFSQMIGAVAD